MVALLRRPFLRFRRIFSNGCYIELQWGKDTHGHGQNRTDVHLSVRTIVYFDSFADYLSRRSCIHVPPTDDLVKRFALKVIDRLTVSCILDAFLEAAHREFGPARFVNINIPGFFSGLTEVATGEELRCMSRSLITAFDAPRFPRALAVLRILNYRGSRVAGREYEYWVEFDVCNCTEVYDYYVGTKRPGRRKAEGQTELGDFV